MTQTTIAEKLRYLTSQQLGISEDEITPASLFRDDLGADSLDCVELIMSAEDAFHIEIDDDSGDRLTTFGALVTHVTGAMQKKRATA